VEIYHQTKLEVDKNVTRHEFSERQPSLRFTPPHLVMERGCRGSIRRSFGARNACIDDPNDDGVSR